MDKNAQIKLQKRRHMEKDILTASILNEGQLYITYGTSASGFTEDQANELIDEHGENVIDRGKEKPMILKLLSCFTNPFSGILFVIAIVSVFTDVVFAPVGETSWATIIILLFLIGLAGFLEFFQEMKSERAAKSLESMVSAKTTVIRSGLEQDIVVSRVAPGDIISLAAGDMIPADLRILEAKDLFISEAALTGESEPIEKFAKSEEAPKSIIETVNIAFMGTNVISGTARAITISTGDDTYLGSIARELNGTRAQTSFEKGVSDVSKLLLRLTLVMVPIVLIVNGLTSGAWMDALLFAMAVAVGITPELLPMIMTSTLAKGAIAMAKRKTIVKDLSSIQSFGAMDILCTDKTGTLTEDEIVLEKYIDIYGKHSDKVLRNAYLNSRFQTGYKNLMDFAIINRAKIEGQESWADQFEKLDELPFDFVRRRMSVVISNGEKRQLITKGAVEEMLKCCSFCLDGNNKAIDLTDELRERALKSAEALSEEGLRTVAVALKGNVHGVETFGVADESDMVLIGFVAFLDPPKESAKLAIDALREHGVRTVVLSGDNAAVCKTVCAKVGIDPTHIMVGSDVDNMSDEQIIERLDHVDIWAKLSPIAKARVVKLFQDQGHTVGFLGDGINDAPALRQADVGVSVDTAVDIAKESADIILLEKSLMVLEEGVIEGRRTFGNIVKYIKLAASGNFGNMFSVLVASIALPFLPMLPIHILVQNLLNDFSQMTMPFDKMDEEYLHKPQKWNAKSISRFTYVMGPISSVFDVLIFAVLWFVFYYNTPDSASSFQTGWFIFGVLSQVLVVCCIRTAKIPFLQSRPAAPLMISIILVCIAAIVIPYTALGVFLGMSAMPTSFLFWLIGIVVAYVIVTQVVKSIYIRKFGEWL